MDSLPSEITNLIEQASRKIQASTFCIALTGAGISTDSGIPDFRSPGSGLWSQHSPFEVASLSAFRYHPERFFSWVRPLIQLVSEACPNPAHKALAALEKRGHIQSIVTQNIDVLHQRAGSENVIEIHGTFQSLTCLGCYQQFQAEPDLLKSFLEDQELPQCPECGNLLKPDVILFEEQLPADRWNQAKSLIKKSDLMLILGSSLTVAPACNLPFAALEEGADLVIINKTPTPLDIYAQISIQGDLATILPEINKKVVSDV